MKQYNFVHFVGIGGVSMSGIAKVLLKNGVKVSGSDNNDSRVVDELRALGATVYIGHSEENITNQDLVVHTAAVKGDNPELIAANRSGIQVVDRATILGWIMQDYENAVSVAGTHGKTTSTSMMAYILMKAMTDPTVMVGGHLDILNGNFRMGKSSYFVTESCEYCRSFLKFFPKYAIILNVEEDHLDYYKDINDIIDAFSDFAAIVPKDGCVVIPSDDKNAAKCIGKVQGRVVTFGGENATYEARNIEYNQFGYPRFDIFCRGEILAHIELNVPGYHNVMNATACAACASEMGIDKKYIAEGLAGYTGTKRRFEKKGYVNGALVIDDYAHHPTEIEVTLNAVSKIEHNRFWCIFQPHTYTRTFTLFDDFAKVLSAADKLIITDIYAAREIDTGIVSSGKLAAEIPGAMYIKDFSDIESFIRSNAKEGDVVMTMGAGNVVNIAESLVK